MDKIKALIKRIKSYFKKTWVFEDYPIRVWKNQNTCEDKVVYGAGIINWYTMVGFGETPEKALNSLKGSFKIFEEKNNYLHRPGEKVPIKFAPTVNMDKYEEIAVEFFKNILDIDYYSGFFSDCSSLANFGSFGNDENLKNERDKIIKKIYSYYNMDITDIYNEPLWKIFEKLETNKKQ